MERLTSWDSVSVRQFRQIYSDAQSPRSIVSACYGLAEPQISAMRISEFDDLYRSLSFLSEPPESYHTPTVRDLHLIDLDSELEFGCLIDINDRLLKEPIANMHEIVACLYRSEGENYSFVTRQSRAKEMLDVPITEVYGAYADLVEWRSRLFVDYAGLFGGSSDEEDEYPEEILTEEQKAEIAANREKKPDTSAKNFGEKWGMFIFLDRLCQGDITKKSEILQMPARAVFNWLGFMNERDQLTR